MRSIVTFEEIQLLSIREKGAIRVNLSPEKLVIYGKNNTGKSTIIKSIFWLLGLEPSSIFSDRLDKNIMGVLEIKLNKISYFFYRNKDSRKLFDNNKNLLIETERNSEWQKYLSSLFNYPLSLIQYNNLEEYYIGLQGLLTPYYMDQDTSWNSRWIGPFDGLNRYVDFYQQVIEHFTGIISNESVILKQQKKHLLSNKKEYDLKIKIYNQSKDELLESYNLESLPEIDENLFIKTVEDTSEILKRSKKLQDELKNEVTNIVSQKYIIKNLITSAINLRNESLVDLEILNKISNDSTLECPTCGTQHKKTLKANIAVEFDVQGIEENIFSLNQQLEGLAKKEKSAIEKLNSINIEIEKFGIKLNNKVCEDYTFNDILNTYASKSIKYNIKNNIEKTQSHINEVDNTIHSLQSKIDKIDSQKSIKERKDKLKNYIKYYYNQLDIGSNTLPSRVYLKPKLSGSSSSRSILAVHLSYIAMSFKFTDLPIFPIIIDTIQQNGQDIENLDKMVEVISSIEHTQVILGMETLANNTTDNGFTIHSLQNSKFSLLSPIYYNEVMDNIHSLIY